MVKFVNKVTKSKEDEKKKEEKGIQPQPASVSNDDEKSKVKPK